MKGFFALLFSFLGLLFVSASATEGQRDNSVPYSDISDSKNFSSSGLTQRKSDSAFRLEYSTAGMGSNFMSCQPVFSVRDTTFYYISRQTSGYKGDKWLANDTLFKGYFPPFAADSVMRLLTHFSSADTAFVYPFFMSGYFHFLSVSKNTYKRSITLHNTAEICCWRVVQLLNSFITNDKHKLFMIFSEDLKE
ncbi:MAG: hypothetical protein ACK5Z2_18470 [Bacteroidota bacterium]|jgi:hypothetical protein